MKFPTRWMLKYYCIYIEKFSVDIYLHVDMPKLLPDFVELFSYQLYFSLDIIT